VSILSSLKACLDFSASQYLRDQAYVTPMSPENTLLPCEHLALPYEQAGFEPMPINHSSFFYIVIVQ
jgi:hypothetical protein